MTKSMKRIHRVVVKRMVDDSPDTSRMGEYSNTQTSEYSIDRSHAVDCPYQEYNGGGDCEDCSGNRGSYREYRYFNPSFNYVDKQGNALPGNTPDMVRKYVREDYERMEAWSRGDWGFVGIAVEAEIVIPVLVNRGCVSGREVFYNTIQRICSGGLWGIESDSDSNYLAEVTRGQLDELREQLYALGFSKRAIATAFKNVERCDG